MHSLSGTMLKNLSLFSSGLPGPLGALSTSILQIVQIA